MNDGDDLIQFLIQTFQILTRSAAVDDTAYAVCSVCSSRYAISFLIVQLESGGRCLKFFENVISDMGQCSAMRRK